MLLLLLARAALALAPADDPGPLEVSIDAADVAWQGGDERQFAGEHVRVVGDVDGDGFDDIVSGVRGYDTSIYGRRVTNPGAVMIAYGRPELGGTHSALEMGLWVGWSDEGDLGYAVGSAGDVDGDGFDDFLAGAPGELSGQGRAWLVYGDHRRVVEPVWMGLLWVVSFTGVDAGDRAGDAVGPAGDVNGDGFDDFLIGARDADAGAGSVYLVHGRPARYEPSTDLGSVLTFYSDDEGAQLGTRYSMAHGDVDGDGLDDLLLGAGDWGDDNAGAAWLWSGADLPDGGSLLVSDAATALHGASAGGDSRFGYAVNAGGDIDGDGTVDISIGAYRYDDPNTNAGRAYLFQAPGALSGIVEADAADVVVTSDLDEVRLGREVWLDSDLDGDGAKDWVIGMYRWDVPERLTGAVLGFLGGSLSGSYTVYDADLWIGGSGTRSYTGYAVDPSGDIDGDGLHDLVIGSPGVESTAGRISLFYGSSLLDAGL